VQGAESDAGGWAPQVGGYPSVNSIGKGPFEPESAMCNGAPRGSRDSRADIDLPSAHRWRCAAVFVGVPNARARRGEYFVGRRCAIHLALGIALANSVSRVFSTDSLPA
jgi:hypothetical protein